MQAGLSAIGALLCGIVEVGGVPYRNHATTSRRQLRDRVVFGYGHNTALNRSISPHSMIRRQRAWKYGPYNARIGNVEFAPVATVLLRRREMGNRATNGDSSAGAA